MTGIVLIENDYISWNHLHDCSGPPQQPANISHVLLTDIKRRFLDAHSSWTGALPECYQPQLSVWMVVYQPSSIHEWSRVICHNRREVNFQDAYGLHERWTSATSNLPFC